MATGSLYFNITFKLTPIYLIRFILKEKNCFGVNWKAVSLAINRNKSEIPIIINTHGNKTMNNIIWFYLDIVITEVFKSEACLLLKGTLQNDNTNIVFLLH